MPRIAPLAPPYAPPIAALLARWMPPDAQVEPLALFRTLAVHDELFSRMLPLGAGVLGHGRIPSRDREIVIHRATARAGAEYEWGVHAVVYGCALGLTEAQLAATVNGPPDDTAWSDADGELIALVDELHDTCTVSNPTWNALAARYSEDQLLELVITTGWYRLIAYVVNAARIDHEPWAARFPSAP